MNKINKLILVIFFVLLLGSTVLGVSKDAREVKLSLEEHAEIVDMMKHQKLTTNRVEDLLYVANALYKEQLENEENGSAYNYNFIKIKLNEIEVVSEQAFNAYNELKLLEIEMEEIRSSIDMEEIDGLYIIAKQELDDERYSTSIDKIDDARKKISELNSFNSRARAISTQLSKGLLNFIWTYKYIFLVIILVPLLIYLIFKKQIRKHKLNKRLKEYETQKTVLHNLIKKLQNDYFIDGNVPETSYTVKLQKYEELIRDVERKVAIVKEELLLLR
jgi:hypothetical protein